MVRHRSLSRIALLAVAIGAASPSLAQGLGDRLGEAEKKLDADIKACRPINIAEYQLLVNEATRNKARAEKAPKGIPIDTAQVAADVAKAHALLLRAVSAAATSKACPPPQQQPQAPKQAAVPPKAELPQASGILKIPQDPVDELIDDGWNLLDDLYDAMWDCDEDAVKKMIPELEELLKRVRSIAKTAKNVPDKYKEAKGKENIDRLDRLAGSLSMALFQAKEFKACPKLKLISPEFRETPPPKTERPGQAPKPEGTSKTGKSSLDDLFKPPAKPSPPKISIADELVEPPSREELNAIGARLRELGELGKTMKGMPGCDAKAWDAHVKHLEDLAKRTRQMAEWAKAPGQTTGVDPKEAERVANEAQRQLDEAKKAKPAGCPKTAPQPKGDNTHGMISPQPSPFQNVGTTQAGPYAGSLRRHTSPTEARTAKQEFDSIIYGWSGLAVAFASSDGCDQQLLQRYVAGLEELERRARALAPLARQAGEFSTVNADQAQKLAENLQRHIDEAKQFVAVDCPAGVRFKMNPWNGRILAMHNEARAAVGADPLRWDPVLAAHADSYAQILARTGQLTHSSREGRGIERENLGQGRIGWSPQDIVRNQWTSEKRFFHAGIYPDVCLSGDWQQCSHYSQEIWPTTTDIGCGYAVGSGYSWLVCRYSPGGNKDKYPVGYYDPWSRGALMAPPPPPPPPPPP